MAEGKRRLSEVETAGLGFHSDAGPLPSTSLRQLDSSANILISSK
jgi:hypothetical protein